MYYFSEEFYLRASFHMGPYQFLALTTIQVEYRLNRT